MMTRVMLWRCVLLLLGLMGNAGITVGCRSEKTQNEKDAAAAQAMASSHLPDTYQAGCSQRAWLGGKGNAGDSGYCNARLKLPLNRTPAWEYSYSQAELSDSNLNSLLHYDGRVYLSAYCPQIVCLRTQDGSQISNSVEFASQTSADAGPREYFTSLYLHQSGLLLGSDNFGRRYCWQPISDGIERRWLRSGPTEKNFLGVPLPGLSVASFEEGLVAMKLEDGARAWGVPVLQRNRRFRDNSNMVATDDGTLVWCSGYGDMEAFKGESGEPLWAAAVPSTLRSIALDQKNALAYVAYQNELVECRSMADGSLLWDFNWGELIPAQERAALQAEMEEGETYRARLSSLTIAPDGVVLSLYNGYCINLSRAGEVIWQRRCDSMLFDTLVLDNAFLLTQFAAIPRSEQRRAAQGSRPLLLPPWHGLRARLSKAGIDVPEYKEGQLNVTYFAGQLGGVAIAVRFTAVDPATGAELDSHESDVDFAVGPVPAYNMLLAGGGRRLSETLKTSSKEPRIVQAFDWLEWEGT